jgi:hypothetical protein
LNGADMVFLIGATNDSKLNEISEIAIELKILISGGLIPSHLWRMIEITNFSPRRGATENTPLLAAGRFIHRRCDQAN